MLDKIKKLLALASDPAASPQEAETAARQARERCCRAPAAIMIKIYLYTDDGELGLTGEGRTPSEAIDDIYFFLLKADPEGMLPDPPHDMAGFQRWCFEYLDGATASIKGLD